MKITPLAADSLGAPSMATLVETPDVTVLIDPGVRLAPHRHQLLVHAVQLLARAALLHERRLRVAELRGERLPFRPGPLEALEEARHVLQAGRLPVHEVARVFVQSVSDLLERGHGT